MQAFSDQREHFLRALAVGQCPNQVLNSTFERKPFCEKQSLHLRTDVAR